MTSQDINTAEEYIYTNKLFTNIETVEEAYRVSLRGLKPISIRERARIFNEYKAIQKVDVIRKFYNISYNPETNLA